MNHCDCSKDVSPTFQEMAGKPGEEVYTEIDNGIEVQLQQHTENPDASVHLPNEPAVVSTSATSKLSSRSSSLSGSFDGSGSRPPLPPSRSQTTISPLSDGDSLTSQQSGKSSPQVSTPANALTEDQFDSLFREEKWTEDMVFEPVKSPGTVPP
jgi:hypothetical protein